MTILDRIRRTDRLTTAHTLTRGNSQPALVWSAWSPRDSDSDSCGEVTENRRSRSSRQRFAGWAANEFTTSAAEVAHLAHDPDDPSRRLIREVLGAAATEYQLASSHQVQPRSGLSTSRKARVGGDHDMAVRVLGRGRRAAPRRRGAGDARPHRDATPCTGRACARSPRCWRRSAGGRGRGEHWHPKVIARRCSPEHVAPPASPTRDALPPSVP